MHIDWCQLQKKMKSKEKKSGRSGVASWDFRNEADVSRFYILLIAILTVFALVYCLLQLRIPAGSYSAIVIFAALAVLAEMAAIEIPSLGFASLSIPLYLSLIILIGSPSITAIVVLLAVACRTLCFNRQPSWHKLFDLSANLFNVIMTALVYSGINGGASLLSDRNILAIAISLVTYVILDFVMTLAAKGLVPGDERGRWSRLRYSVPLINLAASPMGVMTSAMYLYSQANLLCIPVILLPLALVRYALSIVAGELKSGLKLEKNIQKLEKNLQSERELSKMFKTDLQKKDEELSIYYEMNHKLGGSSGLEKTLDIIISMVRRLIHCDSCVIFTLNKGELEVCRAMTPYKDVLEMSSLLHLREDAIIQVLKKREPLLVAEVSEGENSQRIFKDESSVMCAPLIVKNELIGVIYVGIRKSGYYTVDAFHQLTSLASFSANAIYIAQLHESERSEKKRILAFFERYVSPEVVNEILKRPSEELGLRGERRKVTVMFLDIRRFTELSESILPRVMFSQLNALWAEMGDIIYSAGGTLLTYMGDALLAVFGAPIAHSDDAQRAVNAAVQMQERLESLRVKWEKEGTPVFNVGIGINTGEVIAGDIGFSKHREYTVLGENVNIASRLEKLNKEYSTRIIISESTYREAQDGCEVKSLGSVTLRGKSTPVVIYELTGTIPAGKSPSGDGQPAGKDGQPPGNNGQPAATIERPE